FKYPGWYDKYGKWWERYADLSKKNGHKPIAFEPELSDNEYPHRCWTCMVPCLIREDTVVDEVRGITLNSPNVLLNQMSPEEREKHIAHYKAGGPAGRPAADGATS
ncbi:MAG: methane monooxygenase, partial [Solirubrobacterales bacterium]|nr:methane monooxygenase [Solirubrobacterales bacterium]